MVFKGFVIRELVLRVVGEAREGLPTLWIVIRGKFNRDWIV